jgi:hypothetical protein
MMKRIALMLLTVLTVSALLLTSGCEDFQKALDKSGQDLAQMASEVQEKVGSIAPTETENGFSPSEILSPVIGPIVLADKSDDKWYFNQYGEELIEKGETTGAGHFPGGGINGSEDTYAWDVNLLNDGDADKYVYAVDTGIVAETYAGVSNADISYGRVLIKHEFNDQEWWSAYLHMKNIRVKPGDTVNTNTILGEISGVGKGGDILYPNHLHFVVYKGKNEGGKLISFNTLIVERPGIIPMAPVAKTTGSVTEPGTRIFTLTPILCWESRPGISYYSIAISKYPYGESNIVYTATNIRETFYQIPGNALSFNQKYRWNVQAWNDVGPSNFSNKLYFQIEHFEAINNPYPVVIIFTTCSANYQRGEIIRFWYEVADYSGSGLKQVELWMATDTDGDGLPNWPESNIGYVLVKNISGDTYTGVFEYTPPNSGTFWFGLHVVNKAGKWTEEGNSHSEGLPGVFGPWMITIE